MARTIKEVKVRIMKKRFATVISLLVTCALLLVPVLSTPVLADSYPFPATATQVADAVDYLRGEQGDDGSIDGFGNSAWVVMAIAAAGEDPHDFGGRDFVSLMEATYDGTQIGDATLLNDDFWGVLGLIAAGSGPDSGIITNSVAFIKNNQNTADHGWGYALGGASDVDDTGAAIMALIAAGESPSSDAIINGLAYIKSQQQENGGFAGWGGTTSADSNAWGIDGILAAGQDPTDATWTSGAGNDPVDDLLTFQQEGGADDGAFYYQTGNPGMSAAKTTAFAITALLGEPLPIVILTPEEDDTIDVRVEGQSQNIWSGSVTVTESWITATNSGKTYHLEDPTALGALDEASQAGGFPYETTDEYGSLYVTSINGEEAQGMSGWMYRVDYYSPGWTGMAEFILSETTPPDPPHQEVLFYYGELGMLPLKIEVDKTEVAISEQFTATVTQYSDDTNTWSPCDGATVHADQNCATEADGAVDITIDADMTLNIYAEKDGFIRSNKVTVTVGTGTGAASEVGFTADIIPAISFTVDPSSIDFGELGPRDTSDPCPITLTNTGAWALLITCNVSDDADGLYVDGLKLDDETWDLFNATIARNSFQETNATLTIPENYTGVGEKGGTIIFWASEAP